MLWSATVFGIISLHYIFAGFIVKVKHLIMCVYYICYIFYAAVFNQEFSNQYFRKKDVKLYTAILCFSLLQYRMI